MAPRLSQTRKPASDPNPRAISGDNSAAVEEASRVQFLSILSQFDGALADLEIAQGPVKAARKKLSSIKGLAKAAGIPAWRLEQRFEEMQRPPHENADNIIAEARERRWAGIITPDQLKMYEDKSTPEEIMDATDWRSRGYKLGVLGRAADLPEGMPARYTQDFLEGHGDGRKSFMLTLATNAPKPAGTTAQQIAADAEAFLAADEEADIAKAARKLKADPEFMAKGAPEPDPFLEGIRNRGDEEGFEMTDEERAAQALRPSVQETEGDSVL